jgi:DNA-binding beta-propeller fold protein YncE
MVADGALNRAFVGDSSTGKILAADYSGAVVDSVSGISAVSDLAVSDDGATLYAAAPGSHEIVALDAATLDTLLREFTLSPHRRADGRTRQGTPGASGARF